ncbi:MULTISPECIES: hypothetical protein [unclassified Microbacterium]|uniref:hypothetical protein n=1 Tax=unclassified Microbacterium TaxID=2609290 RepID=UPI00214BB36E|nr:MULTISPECIES: hypothetical protein [unclassified Microbacterium]MCR2784739.1 hypothetical protein [Microbacterium sp. zg.B96]MDL5352806.1 hypothetical protein [Microbacterium sp. zg-YB36]WIM16278.1 hypothetical protein QNO11_01215 [Microbacterium sp. zg-B96]
MTPRSSSLLAAAGLAVLLVGSLSACATTSPEPGSTGDSDSGAGAVTEAEVDAAWLDAGRMIGIVTQGSSTCVPIADAATVSSAGVLEVTLVDPPDDAVCTADMAPRVTVVAVPEGVDPSQDLEITVTGDGYRGDTDLDGMVGATPPSGETDYLPSAGWVDDDAFVILTWGSSTCVPSIEGIEVTAPDAVMVTFAEPEADQMCTMDMAPRAVLAVAGEDLEDDAPVTLTLTGGGPAFETPVTTTILG